MKLAQYPKYKDSGVEWLGEIPEGWEVKKLKYCDLVIMGQSPDSDDYNTTLVGLPFLQGNADFAELHPNPRIWCDTANKLAEIGDILLSVRAPIGAVNAADQKYGIGRGLCAIRAMNTFQKYLYYVALCLHDELNSIGTGSTYTAVSVDEIKNVIIPQPPSYKQQSIANFLDHKTAKVDDLIKKNKRLVELLKEKRQAIISNAVTKGLDPKAKMKDSGIEWIGEIP
ncbi:MAG: restriction endonuclease subunit S, partial [Candidatus Micrarchaeota archaeon]